MKRKEYSVSLTEMGGYCLEQLAAKEFRTVEHMLQILLHEGIQFYQHEREFWVEKLEEHKEPSGVGKQFYTTEEIIEFLTPEIKWLRL